MRVAFVMALLTLGCEEPAPTPRPAPAPPAPEEETTPAAPDPSPAPPPACALRAPSTWIEGAPDDGTLALRVVDEQGTAVVMDDAGRATRRAFDADAAPVGAPIALELEGARALLALEGGERGTLMLARGSCAEEAHCLLARLLDDDASRLAAPLPGPLRTMRRMATARRVYFAWTAEGGHAGLDIFTLGDGLGRVRARLGDRAPSDEHPSEILGFAAQNDAWAVLWRRGVLESADSEVFLTTDVAHRSVHALHDTLAIDAMARTNREVSLIATFEFSRPHFLRLDPRADEPLSAREIPAGEPPPDPFAERARAFLDVDADGLWLHRQSAAGDALHPPVRVSPSTSAAALARLDAARYIVAWIEDREVRGRVVDCDVSEPGT